MRRQRRTRSVPLARESFSATTLVPVPEPTAACHASDTAHRHKGAIRNLGTRACN
jgi:hypothetical protein